MQKGLSLLLFLGYCTLNQGVFLTSATAQVIPDGTTNTTVDVNGNDFTIEQGDRAGSNLFHSFGEFSVPTDGSAFFNNATDIVNIFSRVTGGNPSNILGLLRANGTANLFLLNPAGIIFGPNARLDIGGSFLGSTADSFLFEDGEFSATDLENPPLLTINAPIGLNFRDNPQDIVNNSVPDDNGSLSVSPGATFALLGGDINFTGGVINSSGSNVFIGGLSESGIISLDGNLNPIFPEGIARADVTFTNGANVIASTSGEGNAGNITIEAGSFSLSDGAFLESSTFVVGDAGAIRINSDSAVTLSGGALIFNNVDGGGEGDSLGVFINAKSLDVSGGAQIQTLVRGIDQAEVAGNGNAGDVIIKVDEDVTFSGNSSAIFSQLRPGTEGSAGNITIEAGSLSISDGATLTSSTFGNGDAGAITINASGTMSVDGGSILSQVGGEAVGNAGGINITAADLSLTQEGRVDASTFGAGDAGGINITATESVTLSGKEGSTDSGIFSRVFGVGKSGGIKITTTNLSLTREGRVDASTFGTGDAGGINITTTNLSLTQGAQVFASTFGQGDAGGITINASGTISADGETQNGFSSGILSGIAESGVGNAGGINITTADLSLTQGGQIAADTEGQGDAGVITIDASTISAEGETQAGRFNSGIFSRVNKTGVGNAGEINITTTKLSLTQGAQVFASTLGQGDAGAITIDASGGTISTEGESQTGVNSGIFSAVEESGVGNAGGVTITTGSLTLTNGGRVSASTLGQGNAGAVEITASDTIIIDGQGSDGTPSLVDSQVNSEAEGDAGGVNIATGSLTLTNGGRVDASTLGQGNAGSLTVEANSVSLDNNASISASTQSGEGGIINLQINEDLTLQNNSFISARAFSDADGGNLDINARFILGFPSKGTGNDIIATAERGNGGNITINARQLFNIQEGEAIDDNGDFIPNNSNDIDVSSQAEGLDGTISISNPDANIRQKDAEIPSNPIESEQAVGQACQGTRTADQPSGLTIKGKGGVPPAPIEPFMADALIPDGKPITIDKETKLNSLLVGESETEQADPNYIPADPNYIPPDIKPIKTSIGDIYPARGIIKTEDGEIILTVYPTDNINTRTPDKSANCNPL